jgi:hypothetical protein
VTPATDGRRAIRAAALVGVALAGVLLWLGDRSLPVLHAATAWMEGGDPSSPFVCSYRAKTGHPCVGCGGTTAFGLASRGRFVAAARANLLGAFAGAAAWLLFGAAALAAASGRAAVLRWTAALVGLSAPIVFVVSLVAWWSSLPAGPGGR